MASNPPPTKPTPSRGVRRIPEKSFFYNRIVPIAFILMALLMVIILALAIAILFGFVHD
jgi:hypothetical protein